jgi:hypothetical protein
VSDDWRDPKGAVISEKRQKLLEDGFMLRKSGKTSRKLSFASST